MLEQHLTELWYGAGRGGLLLEPLAALYGAAVRLRRGGYASRMLKSRRIGTPVILVGNLTVGGTGKTPLVIWLIEQLTAAGLKPGVVSRGFGGRHGREPREVSADSRWEEVGDEPLLIQHRTGCVTVVAADRVAAAREAARHGLDLIIGDDGLQHLALARDCEIAVVDGARGFGNGRLLPAGPLREPLGRLAEVSAIVVNGAPEHPSIERVLGHIAPPVLHMSLVPGAARALSDGGTPPRPLESFRGEPVHAVAGIGNPARFFAMLRGRGLALTEHRFADHHPFGAQDLAFGDAAPVLMTEKDAMRCADFADPRLWYVPVDAQLAPADAAALLGQVLRAGRAAPAHAR